MEKQPNTKQNIDSLEAEVLIKSGRQNEYYIHKLLGIPVGEDQPLKPEFARREREKWRQYIVGIENYIYNGTILINDFLQRQNQRITNTLYKIRNGNYKGFFNVDQLLQDQNTIDIIIDFVKQLKLNRQRLAKQNKEIAELKQVVRLYYDSMIQGAEDYKTLVECWQTLYEENKQLKQSLNKKSN